MTLSNIDREIYRVAVACANGNLAVVARVLEVSRATVLNKVREYGLEDLRPPAPDVPPMEKPRSQFLKTTFSAYKIGQILDALEKHCYNQTRAADYLGISHRCLRYNVKRLREAGYDIPALCGSGSHARGKRKHKRAE